MRLPDTLQGAVSRYIADSSCPHSSRKTGRLSERPRQREQGDGETRQLKLKAPKGFLHETQKQRADASAICCIPMPARYAPAPLSSLLPGLATASVVLKGRLLGEPQASQTGKGDLASTGTQSLDLLRVDQKWCIWPIQGSNPWPTETSQRHEACTNTWIPAIPPWKYGPGLKWEGWGGEYSPFRLLTSSLVPRPTTVCSHCYNTVRRGEWAFDEVSYITTPWGSHRRSQEMSLLLMYTDKYGCSPSLSEHNPSLLFMLTQCYSECDCGRGGCSQVPPSACFLPPSPSPLWFTTLEWEHFTVTSQLMLVGPVGDPAKRKDQWTTVIGELTLSLQPGSRL